MNALNFINEAYQLQNGEAPRINTILQLIWNKKGVDDEFFRSWLMVAVCTFLCPTTCLKISPRCYPATVDLTRVRKLDWCQFVANQIQETATNIDKKNSIRGCVLFLVVSNRCFRHIVSSIHRMRPYNGLILFFLSDSFVCFNADPLCRLT